ncbi:MAG: PAS domain S-box protein, partial [Candidatus Sulfotelmatobacter sp.]
MITESHQLGTAHTDRITPAEAENLLLDLAAVFVSNSGRPSAAEAPFTDDEADEQLPKADAVYRALVEQIPAVIFMAHLDRGIGEAYVSPQIEASLGFSQEEWLEDPIRWYQQIHPDDKQRWSVEAAQMFLSGTPLRSAYRVLARDGRVVWFHCEAKMIRRKNGRPWFIHGIGFDITELKKIEEELQQERNVVSAILHTVGSLVVVLDPQGRIVRFNRASEQVSGYSFAEVKGKYLWD